jgi:hypothetical protein
MLSCLIQGIFVHLCLYVFVVMSHKTAASGLIEFVFRVVMTYIFLFAFLTNRELPLL